MAEPRCQFCASPHVSGIPVRGKPICGECAFAIWLTGRDPIIEPARASPGSPQQ